MEMFEYIDEMKQPYDIFYTDYVHSELHWHYYSEILYMVSGSVRVICNDGETVIRKGDICYLYPLQLHSIKADRNCNEPVKYAVIKFNMYTLGIPQTYTRQMYDCFVYRTHASDFCLVIRDEQMNSTGTSVNQIVSDIFEEYEGKRNMYMLAVQSGIYRLLIMISRQLDVVADVKHRKAGGDVYFYHILEYIDAHSSEQIDVQSLADMCGMSYSHFARTFKAHYGRSCKEYITYIRLNKAQNMLLYSDYDIEYIAQENGFADSSYFIRVYKKWRRITPKQERLQNRMII